MSGATTTFSKEKPPLVGSQHIYTSGYGYGMRYPTERNQMTLPANVPQFRHPPDSERFLAGIRSTQIIKKDDRSIHRNAEQIVFQTTGEIGLHFHGIEPEPLKLNRRPLKHPKLYHSPVPSSFTTTSLNPHYQLPSNTSSSNLQMSGSNNVNSNKPNTSNNPQDTMIGTGRSRMIDTARTGRSEWSDAPSSYRSNPQTNRDYNFTGNDTSNFNSTSDNRYLQTLQTLDSGFARRSRRDLLQASLPPKPQYEMVWLATANDRAAQQSKPWAGKLRRDSNS